MRLSLWQQFSSNHSARFTVVGVFQSAEKATQAADQLQQVRSTMRAWYGRPEHAPTPETPNVRTTQPRLPAEVRVAAQFGADWNPEYLDWLRFDLPSYPPVKTLESLVFVNGTDSEWGARPADTLIERLGGQALVDGVIADEEDTALLRGEVWLYLACLAPDQATAETIENDLRRGGDRQPEAAPQSLATPWAGYNYELALSGFDGQVSRAGQRLRIEHARFVDLAEGLQALCRYLRARGCAEIEYMLAEHRHSDDQPAYVEW